MPTLQDRNDRVFQGGFTLLEMLLVVGVMGAALLLVTSLLEDVARNKLLQANAYYTNSLMLASQDMIKSLDDFNAVYSVVGIPGTAGVMEVPLTNDPANFGINANNISIRDGGIADGIAPSVRLAKTGVRERSPLGDRMSVVFQAMDDVNDPNDERSLGIFVVSLDRIPEKELRAAASALGAGAGYISVLEEIPGSCIVAAGCAFTIRSAFGSWRHDARDFSGLRYGNVITATPPTLEDGGYLVMFHFISESEKAGDYLYRTPQLANPNLNRMYVPIDMNNYSLVGVDNIAVQDAAIAGTATTSAEIHVQGAVQGSDGLQILGGNLQMQRSGQALQVNTINLGQTYDTTDVDPSVVSGQIAIGGNVTPFDSTLEMDVRNNLNATGAVFNTVNSDTSNPLLSISKDTRVSPSPTVNAQISNFNFTSNSAMNVQGTTLFDNLDLEERIVVSEDGNIQTRVLDLGPGTQTDLRNMQATNTLTVNGNVEVQGAANLNSLEITNLQQCDDGC